jgi:carboxyl-terminal processing protease
MRNKKLQVWLPLIFSMVMIAGMFFGYELQDPFKKNNGGSLQEAVDRIKMYYVDPVNIDSLETGAIEDLVNKLDPHSVYFPPVELKKANEDLAGNFEGIGVEFNVFDDTVNVVYVMPGGPSDKAGLQIGDKLLKANDSSLTIRSFDTDEIKKLIRGERDSKVMLQILRGNRQLTIPVRRGTIPVPSWM